MSDQPGRAGRVQVQAWVTPDIRKRLQLAVIKGGTTVNEVIDGAITRYLSGEDGPPRPKPTPAWATIILEAVSAAIEEERAGREAHPPAHRAGAPPCALVGVARSEPRRAA